MTKRYIPPVGSADRAEETDDCRFSRRSSSTPPSPEDAIQRFRQAVIAYHGESHRDFEDAQARASDMAEAEGTLYEMLDSYTRQREEIEEVEFDNRTLAGIHTDLEAQIASLSSQLERLTEKRNAGLSALLRQSEELERLKADSLTADEAQHALHQIPDAQCAGFDPLDCPVCYSIPRKVGASLIGQRHRGYQMRWMIVYRIRQLRLKLACWVFGRGWGGIVLRLWLIRDRAMAAVTPEGGVILAECKALSDALYEPLPGHWQITVARINPPSGTGGEKE